MNDFIPITHAEEIEYHAAVSLLEQAISENHWREYFRIGEAVRDLAAERNAMIDRWYQLDHKEMVVVGELNKTIRILDNHRMKLHSKVCHDDPH